MTAPYCGTPDCATHRSLHPYAALLSSPCQMAEQKQEYQSLTERHVQALWLEQKYFQGLTTLAGENIEVISPGIWNAGPGPDFLKAHLKIGEREVFGDVELHLHEEGWMHHGHHLDERYNAVVLHLTLWKSLHHKPICTKEGKEISRAFLEDALTVPPKRLLTLIDVELYPYKHFAGSGRCAHALFKNLSKKHVERFFQDASAWRLAKKEAALKEISAIPAEQLGGGLARVLGYKNNAAPFLELFLLLSSLSHGVSEELLLACGLRICGFFEERFAKWERSAYYKHLKALPLEGICLPSSLPLILTQVRPLNHPVRRLVYLVKLLHFRALPVLHRNLLALWEQKGKGCATVRDLHALRKEMTALFPEYTDIYWNFYYLFNEEKRMANLPLIGEDLKNLFLVNVVLPLIYGTVIEKEDREGMEAVYRFFHAIPVEQTQKGKYLAHRFFGSSTKKELLNTRALQQGAYQLHHDFCVHYEASCVGCPFVDRYQQAYIYSAVPAKISCP